MGEKSFSEIGKVEAVRQLFEGTKFEKTGCQTSLASVLLIEGINFDLTYYPLKHLGYKAVTEATAELYAALARPKSAKMSLGVSSKLDFEQIKEMWSGALVAFEEFGYKNVDLDLEPSINGLVISLSVVGDVDEKFLKNRPEAKSKDLICVSGTPGAAYLGLNVLQRGKAGFDKGELSREEMEKYKMLVGAYLKPELSPEIINSIYESGFCPAAGRSLKNGLSEAVKSVSSEFGLGAKIYSDKIPFEGGSFDFGKEANLDPVSAALHGGEDCQVLYVVPIVEYEKFKKEFPGFNVVGHLAQKEAGTTIVSPDGVEFEL